MLDVGFDEMKRSELCFHSKNELPFH